MKLSAMKIDSKAIEEGMWIGKKHGTEIPGMGDLCLHVRGLGNYDYRRIRAEKAAAVPDEMKTDGVPVPQETDRIYRESLHEGILLGWQFLQDDNGGEIEHSPQMQAKIMLDRDYSDFHNVVAWAADQVGKIRKKSQDGIAKN